MAKDPQEQRTPDFIAWNVTEKSEKSYWSRVGAAWKHKDGKGFTLQLDMLPINGRIALREPNERQDARP